MRHALIACALLAAPFAAQAEESAFSYNYVDARYLTTDADAISDEGQGGQVKGSFALTNHFFVLGQYNYFKSETIDIGTASDDFTINRGNLGLGAHMMVTDGVDLVGSATYIYGRAEGFGSDADIMGFDVEAGLRVALTDRAEVAASYNYSRLEIDDNTSQTDRVNESSFALDAEFKITPNYSVVGAIIHGLSADTYTVGGRYNF